MMHLNIIKKAIISFLFILLLGTMTGCEPMKECQDIRVELEKAGYLNGWTYVKNIESLDGEQNPVGRILFALYKNEDNSEEYAVLKITKLTVPDSYNGTFCKVNYNQSSDTAGTDDEFPRHYDIIYSYDRESGEVTTMNVEVSRRCVYPGLYTVDYLNKRTPDAEWEYREELNFAGSDCTQYVYKGDDKDSYYHKMNVYIYETADDAKSAYENWIKRAYEIKEQDTFTMLGIFEAEDADVLEYGCIKNNMLITTALDVYSAWSDEYTEDQYDRPYDDTIIDIIRDF